MDGTTMGTGTEKHRPKCLLMSLGKIQKLMRKTCRSMGRNDEPFVITVSPTTINPAMFHIGEELIVEQRNNFQTLFYDDFPE
jgi:hypothetical protein